MVILVTIFAYFAGLLVEYAIAAFRARAVGVAVCFVGAARIALFS
jgi:hypothetical protein